MKVIGKNADANDLNDIDLRCLKVAKAVYQHYMYEQTWLLLVLGFVLCLVNVIKEEEVLV